MLIFSCVRIGWELVAEKTECAGKEKDLSPQPTTEACAKACEGISSMFIFGTNDFGHARCERNGKQCDCYCETSANNDGDCYMLDHKGFSLYKYISPCKC